MEQKLLVSRISRPGRAAITRPGWQLSLVAGVVGVCLGIVARLGDHYIPDPYVLLVNLGGLWLLVAFAVGSLARTYLGGALLGLLSLLLATTTYYVIMQVIEHGIPVTSPVLWSFMRNVALLWFALSMTLGPLLGLAGAVWRRRNDLMGAIAVALLGGALVSESLWLIIPRDYDLDRAITVGVQIIVAAALPLLLLQSWRLRIIALTTTVGFTTMGILTLHLLFDVILGLTEPPEPPSY